MRKKLNCLLIFAFLLMILCSCNNKTIKAYKIDVLNEKYGEILVSETANCGDNVTINVTPKKGYTLQNVFVNGKIIEGNSFIMPNEDVIVSISYSNISDNSHNINIIPNNNGSVWSDLVTASPGETVNLYNFPNYGYTLEKYIINGKITSDSSFIMPDEDVNIEAVFKHLLAETPVNLSLTVSTYTANSHWYAEYKSEGISIDVIVEDSIVFTASNTISNTGYKDNIEFILGVGSNYNYYTDQIRILVAADGNYTYHKYNNGWINQNFEGQFSVTNANIFKHGFNGYIVNVTIPYSSLNTTYENAIGKLTIAPSMRNTTNALKTNWISFSEMDCVWDSPSTHILIDETNNLVKRISDTTFLVVSEGILSNISNTSLGTVLDMQNLTNNKYTLNDWTKNINCILQYTPEEVIFSAGMIDLENKSVIQCFKDMKNFIDEFKKKSNSNLTIVSATPNIETQIELNAIFAFNSMVKDYCESLENVGYIDLCSSVVQNNFINRSLFATSTSFADQGNWLTRKLILDYYGLYNSQTYGPWGDNGIYIQNGNFSYSSGTLTMNSDGTDVIYLEGIQTNDFSFEINITGNYVFNNDEYPKFGITMTNDVCSYSYYVEAINFTNKEVGYVKRSYNGYNWDSAKTYSVEGMEYTFGNYVNLKIEKVGKTINLYANGNIVSSIVDIEFTNKPIILGLFTFNTNVTVKDAVLITK